MALLRNKKAQEGGGTKAAALVAIIAGLVLLYILFLPPSERVKLLGNETGINATTTTSNATTEAKENVTLLVEHPGILEYLPATDYDKSIPSLSLYTKTEATTLQTAQAITVKNSWFSQQAYNLSFTISDLAYTDNIILSFNIDKSKGNLIVVANGNEIYNREVKEKNLAVTITKNLLSSQNSVIIKPSSVGFKFWAANEYQLSNVNLVADITDTSAQLSQSTFVISSTENNNINTATLKFYVDCKNIYDLSKLDVEINKHSVYSQIPACGDYVSQQISPNILASGENMISFRTQFNKPTTAYYNIDNIMLKLKLKEVLPTTYYFDLSSERFNALKTGTKKLNMKMLFPDPVSSKKADIYINGIITGLDTKGNTFNKTISDQSRQGSNSIKIIPRNTFEIVDLKVDYEG